MSAANVSASTKIEYGDALCINDTVPGVGLAVATQNWDSPRDGRMITVKFMTRVETGTYAGLCYSLDSPGTVNISDIQAVHAVGDDGDRALLTYDKLGYRMVDGVYFVRKEEEECNAAMAYPISKEEYDLEYVQHCRKHNRKRKHGDGDNDGHGDSDSDSDSDSAYDSVAADNMYGNAGAGDNSSDSDYGTSDGASESEDSLDGFIVHSDEEESVDDGAGGNGDTCFTHPDTSCDNPDVKAMRAAASEYRKWVPRTAQERAAKSLIDRIEARARHAEDEKRFRRGQAALETDR